MTVRIVALLSVRPSLTPGTTVQLLKNDGERVGTQDMTATLDDHLPANWKARKFALSRPKSV
jgi:hypothetical protein